MPETNCRVHLGLMHDPVILHPFCTPLHPALGSWLQRLLVANTSSHTSLIGPVIGLPGVGGALPRGMLAQSD